MNNPPSSFDKQTLRTALKLAKSGAFEKAQAMVTRIDSDLLSTEDLRTLALIHSYCGHEHDAERLWERICERDDVGLGDFYMLASTEMMLGHTEKAITNLRREISASDTRGNAYYLSVSVISLAFLLAEEGQKAEALDVLSRLDNSESTHIHGVGMVTKHDLLVKLGAAN